MNLIDQYTPVTVDVATAAPAGAAAVAIFVIDGSDFRSGLPRSLAAAVETLKSAGALPQKPNQVVVQVADASTRLVAVGLGERKDLSLPAYRDAAAAVARLARDQRIGRLAIVIDPALPEATHDIAAAVAEGLALGFFQLTQFKGSGSENKRPAKLAATLVVDRAAQRVAASSVSRAMTVAAAQNFARAIAGHPGNVMHPPALARLVQDACRGTGLKLRVLNEKELSKLGMGGILAVGMGSTPTPPRMIVMEWKGQGTKRDTSRPPLLLVGKAITFDTGGISIKPREGMQRMVFDKCGAMAVLGAMLAIARLKLPQPVVGILAAAENHVSATAYRPGDILKMYNGVTVEVTNTDAEGRLVLADALAWGIRAFRPSAAVDLATLTGGVVIALGKEFAGLFGNDDALAEAVAAAAEIAGEKTWRLPIGLEVRELMKSDHADIVNSGGRHAHAIQGAEFLRRFIPENPPTPWVHLDIAGVADTEKPTPLYGPGATGWGVRTLVNWVSGGKAGNRHAK